MQKYIVYLIVLMMLGFSSCGSGSNNVKEREVKDFETIASRTFYSKPAVVMEALGKVLKEYGYDVNETVQLDERTWTISVKKAGYSDIEEDIHKVIVEAGPSGETELQLMVPSSFFGGWGGEPGWADNFFTRVFERIP